MTPVPRWFIAVCWVMAVNFSVWAGLHSNDPEPVRWMVFYAAAAIATAILPGRRIGAAATAVVGAIALAWGVYLVHEVWGVISLADLREKTGAPGVEVARQAGGLLIASAWLLLGAAFRFLRA